MLSYKDCDIRVILSKSLGKFEKERLSRTIQEDDGHPVKIISVFPRKEETINDSLDFLSFLVLFIYRELDVIFGLGNCARNDDRSRRLEEQLEDLLWFWLSQAPAYCLFFILNIPVFFFKACHFLKRNREPSKVEEIVVGSPTVSSRRATHLGQSSFSEARYTQSSLLRSTRGVSELPINFLENKASSENKKKGWEALISPKTLVWDSNHHYVLVWSCLPNTIHDENKGCLTLINLRDLETNFQHEDNLKTKTYAYGLSSVDENLFSKVKGRSNHLVDKYDMSLNNSVYYTCSTLPHVEDVNAIAVCQHYVDLKIALATQHGLRVWACNTVKRNADVLGSSQLEVPVDSVSEELCNDCVLIEEKVIITPCSSQYASTTAVSWLGQGDRIVAFVSTQHKTEMILLGRQTKGSCYYEEIWYSLLVSDLKTIFAGPLLRAFPSFLPSKKIIAVAVCPCRPFMACISNTADVILIETQTWAYTHWSLSLHSDVVALPIIEWFSALNDVTGFLCGTIHGLFQCILPSGRVVKPSDVQIKALNFQFPSRSLKDMIDETSVLTLTSFSLDSQTGSRLAVILTAETTHNSYIFLFRYASQYNAQPFVSYEGTLQYHRLLSKSSSMDIYQKYEPCCVSIGYTMPTISSTTWIAVAWKLFDAYGAYVIEFRFYIWQESIWLCTE